MKTIAEFNKEKSRSVDEDDRYFLDCIPGDGITLLSVSPLSSSKGDTDIQEDENEKEETVRRSLYYLELQNTTPTEEQQTKGTAKDGFENGKKLEICVLNSLHIYL